MVLCIKLFQKQKKIWFGIFKIKYFGVRLYNVVDSASAVKSFK